MSAHVFLAEALAGSGRTAEAIKEPKTVAAMEAAWEYEMPLPEEARQMIAKYQPSH